ncbi:MAG: hypothetical protein AB7E79_05800 [Rhodospirillaceae bacterium]
MNTAIGLLSPLAVAFVLAMALHVFAKERAPRIALLPLAAGIFAGWFFIVRPGWVPVDDVRRVAHIAVGASLLGLVLDAVRPHRIITAILVAVYLLGCAFASVTGTVLPEGPIALSAAVLTGAWAVVAFLVLARFDAMRGRPLSLSVLLTLVAMGLAVLSAIGQDAPLAGLSLVLTAALAGILIFVILTGTSITDGMVLIAGAPMLGIVWALAQRHPDMRLALLCLPLVLFAEATALRVPLPAARISAMLYPLILAALVSLPLGLAALIAFVTSVP